MEGCPVDSFLAYASVVNMKAGGTLGNEGSIVVQPSSAVAKCAPAVKKIHHHSHAIVCSWENF
jgi:hypothetical protein